MLDIVVKEFLDWANETFDAENLPSLTTRLEEEVQELKQSPDDPGEIADIMFFCIWYADLKGWDVSNLLRAKLDIIRNRRYIKGENGHYYRDKTQADIA
jgi:predicted house-cleaning noncanonical NTP pyrophosphatase (MazG superfamily)